MIIVISFLTFPLGASAADPPLAMIQATVQKTLTVLQDPAYQGATHRQERLAEVAVTSADLVQCLKNKLLELGATPS